MTQTEKRESVTVRFQRHSDFRLVPATGAWGGLSPNGEIVVSFFVEHRLEPESLALEVSEDGSARETGRAEEPLVREVQVGLVLRPDVAHSIGRLLCEKARAAGLKPEGDES